MLISTRNKQRGAALISALVVVVLVTVIASRIQSDFFRTMSSVETSMSRQQARILLDSTVPLAQKLMAYDDDAEVDAAGDVWLQPTGPMLLDGGALQATLYDATARFNINSLGGDIGEGQNYTEAQRRFIRLLQTFEELQLGQSEAEAICVAIKDWLDADSFTSGLDGAENNYYTTLSPVPYRTANQFFESVSELQLVRHMTPVLYQQLRPWLVALPSSEPVLNINLASSKLLRTLNSADDLTPLEVSQVDGWLLEREASPFNDLNAFMASPTTNAILVGDESINSEGLAVGSRYIQLETDMQFGARTYLYTALLERRESELNVIQRSYGVL
ncbi:type II secretion system minor pseudopilin GspK [Umboniibacter marinipuniceus]|uniref:Type II secretion system protein K n=1 Tax=Umboniibacter marinipuniceus TaxID=569599 RepID=A0A3M0A8A5_9GAMM|nr:type II secretion system minor pseudopilin GspK [Umboniibacter marinipuniceus]RMA81323.1 type II secretion system protein K (GspK) [Umboniibacter marinipuniceus]